jgi:hypothetical protein
VPTYPVRVPYALAMSRRRGIEREYLGLERDAAFRQYREIDSDLAQLEQHGLLRVVDPKQALCAGERCLIVSRDGAPLYNDAHHVTPAGALLVAPILGKCLSAAGR